MAILITGFEPFGNLGFNPTETAMRHFQGRIRQGALPGFIAEVLPTEFQAAARKITGLLDLHQPEAVVCFGVNAAASAFHIERFALNIDDTPLPDNAGLMPQAAPIVPGGPAAHTATLPAQMIHRRLLEAGYPVKFSNHAGTYVCNHVFYTVCHEIASRRWPTPCGFIHVPLTLPSADAASDPITAGMEICLAAVRAGLNENLAP